MAYWSQVPWGGALYGTLVSSRFKNLIVPMAVWNSIAILIGVVAFVALGLRSFPYEAIQGTSGYEVFAGRILSIDYTSATPALNFLRDVFVCGRRCLPS